MALKGFQLFIASGDLAHYTYIARSDGAAFANILYAQVCGTRIQDVLGYVQSYHEVANNRTTVFARVTGDVGRYITKDNSQALAYCYILLAAPMNGLHLMTQMAVAFAFNDDKRVKQLMDNGDRFLDRIFGKKGGS
jgi:hypothetical protein